MKVSVQTGKFYPCYPVFVLSYYDSDGQIRVSTASSSYSLGDIFVLGLGRKSFFIDNCTKNKGFTVNFLSKDYLKEIEAGGYLSNHNSRNKTQKSGFTFINSEYVKAPVINQASIVFECELEKIYDIGEYCNVVSVIKNRLFDESLLENGNYLQGRLDIPLYEGNSTQRVYRFLSNEVSNGGSFFKKE